jgi:TolB-like protein/Flp pilus assembly protein TadD
MVLISELRRRNVFRVALAYAVIAWLTLQVGDTLAPALRLGDWVNSLLAFFLILGFPMALFFAWAYELTPDGLRKEEDVDRDSLTTQQTGKKFDRLIIGILVVALAYFAVDKFILSPSSDAESVQTVEASAVEEEETVGRNSIAVLPFADLSPEGDQEYFSDGIAEEILNVLVRVEDLNVASRTSSFGFKGQEALGIPTIAEKLNVRHVLEGSVRKAGDTVRITAQLIDASTDQHLWSDTYDRKLTAESIFAIQDEIAQAIARQLGILIDVDSVQSDTQNLDAYELYLKAHKTFIERSDILGAIDLFEQTVALDPEFARALAGLAAAYAIAPSWGFTERDYTALAEQRAQEALEIDPETGIGWAVLGYVSGNRREYKKAFGFYDKALEINPKDATSWLWRGIENNTLGFFDEAAADIERCLKIDPLYGNCIRHLARSRLFSGDIDGALELVERGIVIGFPALNPMFIHAYAAQGNSAVVAAEISRTMSDAGYPTLIEDYYRALVDPDFDFETERLEFETRYQTATGNALDWGEDDAFSPLTFKVFDAVATVGSNQTFWVPYPVEWRTAPRRKAIIIENGLPDYWREHGFPPQCRPLGHADFECTYEGRDTVTDEKDRTRVGAPN